MGATWACQKCGASVMGSYCACEDEKDRRIAELEAELDKYKSVAKACGEVSSRQAKRIAELEAERDSLAKALVGLREAPPQEVE